MLSPNADGFAATLDKADCSFLPAQNQIPQCHPLTCVVRQRGSESRIGLKLREGRPLAYRIRCVFVQYQYVPVDNLAEA